MMQSFSGATTIPSTSH